MPRKMRVEYPGAIYHVMSRGDRREAVFLDDVDRQDFIKTLAETCQKTGFEIQAYGLMPNQVHRVFRRQMLTQMEGELGEGHAGALRREHGQERAERMIAEELKRLGWTEGDLMNQRKKAPGKLDLAARLRRETTLSLKWIAARVHLGTSKSAHGKLHAWMKIPTQLCSSSNHMGHQNPSHPNA